MQFLSNQILIVFSVIGDKKRLYYCRYFLPVTLKIYFITFRSFLYYRYGVCSCVHVYRNICRRIYINRMEICTDFWVYYYLECVMFIKVYTLSEKQKVLVRIQNDYLWHFSQSNLIQKIYFILQSNQLFLKQRTLK